jgi:hypothetical protein
MLHEKDNTGFSMLGKKPTRKFAMPMKKKAYNILFHAWEGMLPKFFPHASQENVYTYWKGSLCMRRHSERFVPAWGLVFMHGFVQAW